MLWKNSISSSSTHSPPKSSTSHLFPSFISAVPRPIGFLCSLPIMPFCCQSLPIFSLRQTLAPAISVAPRRSCNVFRSDFEMRPRLRRRRGNGNVCLAGDGSSSRTEKYLKEHVKKRNIVEHVLLLSAKADCSEDEEKDMLDHLYTSQYQMNGIVSISLGRIVDPNVDNFTHAVCMRFQKKEDVAKFYVNSYYSGILKGHVIPYCDGLVSVDFESEVEEDILSIFRRGEEFDYGLECIILLSVIKTAPQQAVDDALSALQKLCIKFRPFIIQATQGVNFNLKDSEYTHAAVIRFPSVDAFQIFKDSSQYEDMWRLNFDPITRKALVIHFVVDPTGTKLM